MNFVTYSAELSLTYFGIFHETCSLTLNICSSFLTLHKIFPLICFLIWNAYCCSGHNRIADSQETFCHALNLIYVIYEETLTFVFWILHSRLIHKDYPYLHSKTHYLDF